MTLENLRKLLRDNGVEFYIKKQKGDLVKIHVLVEDEADVSTTS
jgi:hypothetical protein